VNTPQAFQFGHAGGVYLQGANLSFSMKRIAKGTEKKGRFVTS